MRVWIAHIISNLGAYNDFHDYTTQAIAGLHKLLTSAVRSGKMEDAREIAHEIKVYEDLKRSVNQELREQRAQADYANQQGGTK